MPAQPESSFLDIAHVLFIDVVGYSRMLIDDQSEALQTLNEIVRKTEPFKISERAGKLMRIPAGDGMALLFFNSPEAPVQCALEISKALKNYPNLKLRMGVNSGPVEGVRDVNDHLNVAGAGINMAQRVMDCGDAGHILLSARVAEDLSQYRQWRSFLRPLGEVEVKHKARISVVNFSDPDVGNPDVPEKLKNARPTVINRPRRLRNVLWPLVVLLAVALPVIFVIVRNYTHETAPAVSGQGIAVLPFENFSDDKDNAFFADGIQDDILTSLAQIEGLHVISRRSVMGYRGGKGTQNLREICKELGVENIMEGSVRREGNRVIVTVQLIDSQDHHIWANRYDRTLVDSLGLQGELAKEIAAALRVTLSPDEKERVSTKPTESADAYVFYLRASQIEHNPDTLLEDFKTAEGLYQQAIELDPNFALAHARLASTCAEIFHYHDPVDSWKTKARSEAEMALRLQPNLAEGHFALGQCYYWMDEDYDRALQEMETAAKLAPNYAEVGAVVAAIKRRQGHWQESLDGYEKIQGLDPQNSNVARNIVFTNTAMRRWPDAARAAERMRTLAPTSLVAKIQSGYVEFWWKGDTSVLKSLLREVPKGTDPDGVVTSCRWEVAMLDRDFWTAKHVLDTSSVTEVSYTNAQATPIGFLRGCIDLAESDTVAAEKEFETVRPLFEKAVADAPSNAERHANLGWLYAFMGKKEEAIREGSRAVELKPESKDAFDGAIMNCYLALIYARVGEKDLAILSIERLLNTPGAVDSADYSITVNDLKYRWEWDPIRDDPRFQNLLKTGEAATSK